MTDVLLHKGHKGFGECSSPSRPQDAKAPGRAHFTGTVYKCAVGESQLPLLFVLTMLSFGK